MSSRPKRTCAKERVDYAECESVNGSVDMDVDLQSAAVKTVKLESPHLTFFGILYEAGQRFEFNDDSDCFIHSINEFDHDTTTNTNYIIATTITKNNILVPRSKLVKSDVAPEFWLSSIKSEFTNLINIKWCTTQEIKHYMINLKSTKLFDYEVNDYVWYYPIIYCPNSCV
eukprot:75770_1